MFYERGNESGSLMPRVTFFTGIHLRISIVMTSKNQSYMSHALSQLSTRSASQSNQWQNAAYQYYAVANPTTHFVVHKLHSLAGLLLANTAACLVLIRLFRTHALSGADPEILIRGVRIEAPKAE